LLGVELKQAAHELEAQLGGAGLSRSALSAPFVPVVTRAFEVGSASGRTLGAITKEIGRASVERIQRDGKLVKLEPDVVLQSGDVVGIAGRLEALLVAPQLIGKEIEHREALSFAVEKRSVVLSSKKVIGQTLGQIRALIGEENLEGVYLAGFKRQGLALPALPGTEVRRGDILELMGRPKQVEHVARLIGSAEATDRSDLAFHALGIVAGTLLGSISASVGGIPVTLGLGGGVLVAGLCFGWLHVRYPFFGTLPGPAQWILSELGLSAFAAAVGLAAGPLAVSAIREHGLGLLFDGAIVTLVPLIVALGFGRLVLKLHPVILLGALCGGQTVAAALNTITETAESSTPVLGFTMPYAVSNVLLAVWGPVIVAFT
jgi:AspT/YidE/YbjL antiporter-like protein